MKNLNLYKIIATGVILLVIAFSGARIMMLRQQMKEVNSSMMIYHKRLQVQNSLENILNMLNLAAKDLQGFRLKESPILAEYYHDKIEQVLDIRTEMLCDPTEVAVLDKTEYKLLSVYIIEEVDRMNAVVKTNHSITINSLDNNLLGVNPMKAQLDNINTRTEQLHALSEIKMMAYSKLENEFATYSFISMVLLLAAFSFILYTEVKKHISQRDVFKNKEKRLATALENIGEGVIISDTSDNITYLNTQAEALLGYSIADIEDKSLHQFFRVHDENTGLPVENLLSQLLGSDTPAIFSNHSTLTSRNGSVLIIESCASEIKRTNGQVDGTVLVFRDVTAKKIAADNLQEAEERYESIFNNISEGIYRTTLEGDIVFANPAFARILGFKTPDDMKYAIQNASQLYSNPSDRGNIIANVSNKGRVINYEVELNTRNKQKILCNLNIHAVYDQNNNISYLEGTIIDITQRKEVEELLIKRNKELEAFYDVTVGRELRIIELKKEINNYLEKTGEHPKYEIP